MDTTLRFLSLLFFLFHHDVVSGFRSSVSNAPITTIINSRTVIHGIHRSAYTHLRMSNDLDPFDEDNEGYTRKQIIKEEIEAPFRKVRMLTSSTHPSRIHSFIHPPHQ